MLDVEALVIVSHTIWTTVPGLYNANKAPDTAWKHDMFLSGWTMFHSSQFSGVCASIIGTRTKLYISNLDFGGSNEDIK